MDGGGVQVDADLRALDDLGQEEMREPGRKRARRRTRERAVEVAPVGQIARAADEAEHVDDGHAQQRAADAFGMQRAQQPADDLDAVELIAVNGRADEHGRPRPRAVQNVHRQGDGRVVRQLRYGQVHEAALARLHGQSTDDKRLPHDGAFHTGSDPSTAYEVHGGWAHARSHAPHPFQYWQTNFLCVRRWRSEVLLATSQCTIVDLRSNIFVASIDTSSRFSFSVAIQDDSSREASFRIDRECAECLHPGIAPFKTGEVGKAPGTAIQPTPAFSARRFGFGWRALKRQGS